MAQRSEIAAVYGAGIVQGVALVTFPAASEIFTSIHDYGLSHTAYGSLFLPQAAAAAVAASLLGAGVTRRLGIKRVYLLGLVANLLSMVLLLLSRSFMADQQLAYGILLAATASLGAGFGLTVPSLNTFAADFFPLAIDRAVLAMNAVLGLGTVLAPVFVAIFVRLSNWIALPLVLTLLLLALLALSGGLPLNAAGGKAAAAGRPAGVRLPPRFWLFALFAALYGVVETMNGNWSSLYMANALGAGATLASLALAVFWGMVTAGRILFGLIEKEVPERLTYRVLPFLAALALASIAALPAGAAFAGLLAFALSGLGCSALLPLTISFGQKQFPLIASSVAGGLIAFYQMGYGIAAFGVGPIQSATGLELNGVFGIAAVLALAMAAASFIVTPPRSQAAVSGAERSIKQHESRE